MLTHVDDVHAFLKAVRTVLKTNGWLVVEVYYLMSILRGTLFDLVYHEHMSYWTMETLNDLAVHMARVPRVNRYK